MNIPPTVSQLDNVKKWSELLCQAFASCPFDVAYDENTDAEPESPTHIWQVKHDTLPDRVLAVMFGIAKHSDDCQCMQSPPICLRVLVMDTDTEDRVPESGMIDLTSPVGPELVLGMTMLAVAGFMKVGNI